MTFLIAFMQDTRTLTLFGLIVIDFIVGIAAAARTHTFAWRRTGDWYLSNVLPFILGYLLIYGVSALGLTPLFGDVLGEIGATIGMGPAVLSLGGSIAGNLAALRAGEQATVTTPAPATTVTSGPEGTTVNLSNADLPTTAAASGNGSQATVTKVGNAASTTEHHRRRTTPKGDV